MTLYKTRIKKEELANGRVLYHPQYRWMGFWLSLTDLISDEYQPDKDYYPVLTKAINGRTNSLEDAKNIIDYYIKRCCKGIGVTTVVKTEDIKYP